MGLYKLLKQGRGEAGGGAERTDMMFVINWLKIYMYGTECKARDSGSLIGRTKKMLLSHSLHHISTATGKFEPYAPQHRVKKCSTAYTCTWTGLECQEDTT